MIVAILHLLQLSIAPLLALLVVICAAAPTYGQDTPPARLTYARAFEIALWAMPVADTLAPRRAGNERGIPSSALFITEHRPTGKVEMVTCNLGAPYVFGDLTTREGPIVFDVPPVSDKAMFSGSIFDAWWKPLEDVGLDGADAGKGGKYLVLPPDYQGAIPDGYVVLHSRTYRINALFRVVPAEHGEAGWNPAVVYAKTLKVYPLTDDATPKHVAFVDVSGGAFPGTPRFDRRYFEYVNQIVQEEPVFEYDKGIVGMAASLGIEKGKPFQPDVRMGHILDHAAQGVQRYSIAMMMTLKGAMMGGARFWPDRHWVVPGLTRDVIDGGAQWVFPNRLDYVERASFYYFGVGVPKRSGTRGIYILSTVDAKGVPLNGSKHYRLRLPKDVPAKDFWEVIAYSVVTRSYIDTPANRIDVSSAYPTYKTNNDGSIDIYFGPTPPPRREGNWISTRLEEPYEVTLHFYGPQQRLVEKQWVAGEIEEISAISASGGRALQ